MRSSDKKSHHRNDFSGSKTKNYYQILNLSTHATKNEIRESYIRLRNTYGIYNQALYSLISEHEAQKTMAEIEEAFKILNDDLKRQHYNEQMGLSALQGKADSLNELTAGCSPQSDAFSGIDAKKEGVEIESVQGEPAQLKGARFFHERPLISTMANSMLDGQHRKQILQKMDELITEADCSDGDLYRRLRELAGVSENEMQERIKVSIEYIRAIESNSFNRLPQPVFVKGFLRSYLKYLAVPQSDKLVNAYAGRLETWLREKENKN